MKTIFFDYQAFKQYQQWLKIDKIVFLRISCLILQITKTPFTGAGNPQLLKEEFKGYWSRKIDDEYRLIYKIAEDNIIIVFC